MNAMDYVAWSVIPTKEDPGVADVADVAGVAVAVGRRGCCCCEFENCCGKPLDGGCDVLDLTKLHLSRFPQFLACLLPRGNLECESLDCCPDESRVASPVE